METPYSTLDINKSKNETNYAAQLGASVILTDSSNIYFNYARGFMSPNPRQFLSTFDVFVRENNRT